MRPPSRKHHGTSAIRGEGVDPARIGERVWTFNAAFQRAGGTCAEVCVLPAELTAPLPDTVSFEAGAALGVPALTAHRAVTVAGPVEGKVVLVAGGAGAVGNQAIQLARRFGAARVLATVSNPEKAQAAWDAGADDVIDYTRQGVAEAVEAATGGHGVDHIVEVEFGANLPQSLSVLRAHGSIAAYGSEGERTPELPFYDLMFKNISVYSLFVYSLTLDQRARAVSDVVQALKAGALDPRLDTVFDLEEAADAHRRVEDGVKIGSVVVRV